MCLHKSEVEEEHTFSSHFSHWDGTDGKANKNGQNTDSECTNFIAILKLRTKWTLKWNHDSHQN